MNNFNGLEDLKHIIRGCVNEEDIYYLDSEVFPAVDDLFYKLQYQYEELAKAAGLNTDVSTYNHESAVYEIKSIKHDSDWCSYLDAAGIDNTTAYEHACDMAREDGFFDEEN